MAELFTNAAETWLVNAIDSNEDYIIEVSSVAKFPATGNFRIVIDEEYLLVTDVDSDNKLWTTTRAIEGTEKASHQKGARVRHTLTAGGLQQIIEEQTILAPGIPPTINGSRTTGTGLAELLTALEAMGIIVDNTTG